MVLASAALLLPTSVFAMGFAKQSLFLSQATVSEGQTVFIYAVITNDTANYFNGKLVFNDGDEPIGTTTVALDSDRASAYSVSWKPKEGQHNVAAKLVDASGKVVSSEDTIFFIDPPPQPAQVLAQPTPSPKKSASDETPTDILQTSEPIEKAVTGISPYVGSKVAPVFNAIDAARAKAAFSMGRGSGWSKQQIAKSALAKGGFGNTLWLILSTMALYVCTALAYVINNIGVFYPVLLALFFFGLWRLYKLVRR
jgi:hypothetical protein